MEVIEFNKVLAKALDIVDVGIRKGYFDGSRKDELNNKLISIYRNGIVYDLPGTAVYGMYSPSEKKLYFNAKVFKNEEEALIYILHEIKHGLDHYDDIIGFEYQDKGVGINEGATQRFATDMAEEILQKKFSRETQSSLGVRFNTHLDEYQIEDKLNELFCIAMGISMEDFIKMQNNPQKEDFRKLVAKFNQYASYEVFKQSIDEIYKIQEETWFDEKHNMLDKEKEPTIEQTKRAIELISRCKKLLLKYAQKENSSAVDRIKEVSFVAINEYGEIIRDSYDDEHIEQTKSEETDVMSEENIVTQADYIDYQRNILNQIGSNVLNNECDIIFITEFRYEDDNCEKIVYFRKGDSYQKIVIPMKDDKTMDITNISVQKVDDVNEIKLSIEDCEAEFGVIANAPEYAKILSMSGDDEKAQSILNKWNYFLSKQNELDQIRQRVEEQHRAFSDEIERLRSSLRGGEIETSQQSYFDTLFNKTIEYGNIVVSEDGITIINSDGSIRFVTAEEEEQYISQIRNALENGEITLTRIQQGLLDSYSNGNSPKKR